MYGVSSGNILLRVKRGLYPRIPCDGYWLECYVHRAAGGNLDAPTIGQGCEL